MTLFDLFFIFSFNKTLKLFVAGYDGVVGIYEVNSNDGGECKQIGHYLLFNMSSNSNNQPTTIPNGRRNTGDKFFNKLYYLEFVSFCFDLIR
jgi:hypothetical protein